MKELIFLKIKISQVKEFALGKGISIADVIFTERKTNKFLSVDKLQRLKGFNEISI
jgi:hypothetical protein